jgi:hypothetical protein
MSIDRGHLLVFKKNAILERKDRETFGNGSFV